eukprot:CAMPEP_0168527148 /NCGR_PEP_ID=MMETSP0405-20121227/12416_1 /TAXON_ID=498012 /ORGANISM="Trichosphaerium sp, Strain Am-I-7 wt" /LENGTH=166 /DNA_ID=CAMNT_0008550177 /DNA_START=56 /DNA_END=556 /DNA_ORIENTATION=-
MVLNITKQGSTTMQTRQKSSQQAAKKEAKQDKQVAKPTQLTYHTNNIITVPSSKGKYRQHWEFEPRTNEEAWAHGEKHGYMNYTYQRSFMLGIPYVAVMLIWGICINIYEDIQITTGWQIFPWIYPNVTGFAGWGNYRSDKARKLWQEKQAYLQELAKEEKKGWLW